MYIFIAMFIYYFYCHVYIFYFYICVYVFLLLCMFCSVYSVHVPTGTPWLSYLRVFHAFSSVVRKMPGYNSQKWGTARTLPN